MNNQTITLDLSKIPADMPTVYLREGDVNGLNLTVHVLDHGESFSLSSLDVTLMIRLNFTAYEYEGETSGNAASFTVDSSDMQTGETDIAYVSITDGDYIASTGRFIVEVLPSADGGD